MLILFYTALWLMLVGILWQQGHKLDHRIKILVENLMSFFFSDRQGTKNRELTYFLSQLIANLKVGNSLENSLSTLLARDGLSPELQVEFHNVLHHASASSPLSALLLSSLKLGNPCIEQLQKWKRHHVQELKSRRRIDALSSQCRAQNVLVCLIPWSFFVFLFFSSPDLVFPSLKNFFSIICFLVAIGLSIFSFYWMRNLNNKVFLPKGNQWFNEHELFPFLQEIFAYVSGGIALEEAIEKAGKNNSKIISHYSMDIRTQNPHEIKFAELSEAVKILQNGLNLGCPVLENISDLLEEIRSQKEIRIEEAIQLLPIKSLGPLFLCAFPSALLVLFAIFSPLLEQL